MSSISYFLTILPLLCSIFRIPLLIQNTYLKETHQNLILKRLHTQNLKHKTHHKKELKLMQLPLTNLQMIPQRQILILQNIDAFADAVS